MHSIRKSPICRARDTLSASAVVWSRFVQPIRSSRQRTPGCAFTTEAAKHQDDETTKPQGEETSILKEQTPYAEFKIRRFRSKVPTQTRYDRVPTQTGSKRDPTLNELATQNSERLLTQAYEAYERGLDYRGVVVKPLEYTPADFRLPWQVKNRHNLKSGEERLDLEIQKYHEYVRPTPPQAVARRHLIEQVRRHVRLYLPDYVLEVFGSERTGLSLAMSDIDLGLIPRDLLSQDAHSKLPPSRARRDEQKADLSFLCSKILRNHKLDYTPPVIRWARFPLISLHDRSSGLDVQVVLSNDTSLSRKYIQRYIKDYPYLPQLYSIIKGTLDARGLNNVFKGGVGSYSLFMLIVTSLKLRPNERNDAAGGLLNFFQFWAAEDTDKYGYSVDPPERFLKSEQTIVSEEVTGRIAKRTAHPPATWMLVLRDPADETNDLGRKFISWKHAKATFQSLHLDLKKTTSMNKRASLIADLVGSTDRSGQKPRRVLKTYGRSLILAARYLDSTRKDELAGAEAVAGPGQMSEFDHLVATARDIRNGHDKNLLAPDEPTAQAVETQAIETQAIETQAVETAEQAGAADNMHSWLSEITDAPDHQDTREAFSNILGLDETATTPKQEP